MDSPLILPLYRSWFQQRDGLKKEDLDLLDDMFTGETVVSLKAELEGVRAELAQSTTTNQRINLDLENALGELGSGTAVSVGERSSPPHKHLSTARIADLEGQLASMYSAYSVVTEDVDASEKEARRLREEAEERDRKLAEQLAQEEEEELEQRQSERARQASMSMSSARGFGFDDGFGADGFGTGSGSTRSALGAAASARGGGGGGGVSGRGISSSSGSGSGDLLGVGELLPPPPPGKPPVNAMHRSQRSASHGTLASDVARANSRSTTSGTRPVTVNLGAAALGSNLSAVSGGSVTIVQGYLVGIGFERSRS